MDVTFWGVRGSIPCCGKQYLRVGGHSSCVSVLIGDTLIIFDAGTGLRDLGTWLEDHPHIREAHLFLSHAHYDHLIGFPFFKPLWREDFSLTVYATILDPYGGAKSFFEHRLFAEPFFPVRLDMLKCRLDFRDSQNGEVLTFKDGIEVFLGRLNHPGGASGFRLSHQGACVAYVSDTEHGTDLPDNDVQRLIQNADLVIYDATFTDEEYPRYKGWGHSTWQEGMRLCQDHGVQQMAIYHHDPSHTDEVIDKIENAAKAAWPGLFVARQGMTLRLPSPGP